MAPLRFLALAAATLALVGCNPSDDAGTGMPIDTGGGVGETCSGDVNCRGSLACIDMTCQPPGDTAEGAACQLTAECADGLYCAPNVDPMTALTMPFQCAEAGEAAAGEPCAGPASCQAGLSCLPDGFAAACQEMGDVDVGGACEATTDCYAGLGCAGGMCVSDPTWTPFDLWTGVACAPDSGPARALFTVPRGGDDTSPFFALPYPNDIRRTANGLDLSGHPAPPLEGYSGPIVDSYVGALESLDGFGQNPTVYFRFSEAIDLESLNDAAGDPRFVLYDVDDSTAEDYGESRGLSWAAATGPGSGGLYRCDNWLGLRLPWGRPLEPGHTYVAVLYEGITTEDGAAIARDGDFDAMMADSAPGDPALASAWAAYAPLREFASSGALDAATVVSAAVFTTQSSETMIPALRDAVRASDAPEITELSLCTAPGDASPCDDGLSGDEKMRGCLDPASDAYWELQGRVNIPVFQTGTAPYETFEDGGEIALQGGNPAVQGSQGVCVAMTVPKGPEMPADGWPLIVYAHGSNGDYRSFIRRDFGTLTSTLPGEGTEVGAVVLGFDAVVHGDRAAGSETEPQDLYFNFLNPPAARGHVVQGVADIMQLVRVGESGWELSADVSPTGEAIKIDPARIYLVAHSQGTQYGTIALAHEPLLSAGVLSGAGGGLMLGLLEKTLPVNIAAGIRFALADPGVDEFHPALGLVQAYFDVGDPVNYAESLLYEPTRADEVRPHLLHVMGIDDNYTPDASQRALAVGTGALLVDDGVVDTFGGVNTTMLPATTNFGNATALARQFLVDGDYDGHFVAQRNAEARGDIAEFLGSLVATGVPTVE